MRRSCDSSVRDLPSAMLWPLRTGAQVTCDSNSSFCPPKFISFTLELFMYEKKNQCQC